jgi:hypothetical protein
MLPKSSKIQEFTHKKLNKDCPLQKHIALKLNDAEPMIIDTDFSNKVAS